MISSPFHSGLKPLSNGSSRFGNGKRELNDMIQGLEPRRGGPESGMAIPHALSMQAVIGTAFRTYFHARYDEAIRDSQQNADAMRNDPFIMRLVQENKDAVASLKWSVEVDNERDPWQKCIKNSLTQQYRAIPYAEDLNQYLLEAEWYGRYGGQFSWEYRNMDLPALPKGGGLAGNPFLPGGAASLGRGGLDAAAAAGAPSVGPQGSLAGLSNPGSDREKRKALCVKWHIPYEGDKIGYDYEGTPYVLVSVMAAERMHRKYGDDADIRDISNTPNIQAKSFEYGYTTAGGKALFLRTPSWRQRFAIHRGKVLDGPFLDAEKGDQIHGIGIRSVIYWYWWLRDEFMANVTDWCARTGMGVRLWYYDASNPASEAAVDQAARDQSDKVNIKIPRTPGANAQEGVEFVDTTGTGADLLLRIVQYLDEQIMLYVVGQSMSSGSDTQDGLGGTGRAKFAQSTKYQITRRNAAKYSDTCTYDILDVMKRHSFPQDLWEIPARLVYHPDTPDPKDYLESVKTIVELGATVREDDVRGVVGLAAPHEGDRVLGGQQPLPPGVGGGGVPIPGEEKPEVGGKNDAPNEHNGDTGAKPGGVGVGIYQGDGQVTPADPIRRASETAQRMEAEGEHTKYGWVTIGGKSEGDEKHVGGFHVFFDADGKITHGGTPAMHGKPLHEAMETLHKFDKEDSEKEKPESKPAHSAPAEAASEKLSPSAMKAHAESLKAPKEQPAAPAAEKPVAQPAAPPSPAAPAPAAEQPRPSARPEAEAKALFDSLPKSGLSRRPLIAEQVAKQFAKGDRDKWDEYTQVAALKLHEAATNPSIDAGAFAKQAGQIAQNAITSHLRGEGAQKRGSGKVGHFGEDFDAGNIKGSTPSPDAAMQKSELQTGVQKAIATMDPRDQEVAKGLMAGETGAVIAKRLGVSQPTVTRTLERLQQALAEFKDDYAKELLDKVRYALETMEKERYGRGIQAPILPEVLEEILEQSKSYGPRAADFIRACMEAMRETDSQWEAINIGRVNFGTHGSQQGSNRYEKHAKEAVDRVIAEMESVEATRQAEEKQKADEAARVAAEQQRERYEAEQRAAEAKAKDREHEAILESIPTILETMKPIPTPPVDLEAILRAIREMPPPVINVVVPEQPAPVMPAAAPLDVAALGKAIADALPKPQERPTAGKIKRGKDGEYSFKVE